MSAAAAFLAKDDKPPQRSPPRSPPAAPQPAEQPPPATMTASAFLAKDQKPSPPRSPPAAPQRAEQPPSAKASAFLAKDQKPVPPRSPLAAPQPTEQPPVAKTKAAAFLNKDEPAAEAPAPTPPSPSLAAAFLAKDQPAQPADAPPPERPADEPPPTSLTAAFIASTPAPPAAAPAPPPAPPPDPPPEPAPALVAEPGRSLSIEIGMHALRIDESARIGLLQRGARRLWLEVSIEPSVLLPSPLRSARVSTPTAKPRDGAPLTELPIELPEGEGVVRIDEHSALARALAAAITSEDPRSVASVRLTLHGTSPQQGSTPLPPQATALCEATVSLQQLLRRGVDLKRAPLQLYGREDDDTHGLSVGLLLTLHAVEALKVLVPTPLPVPAPIRGVAAASKSAVKPSSTSAPSAAPPPAAVAPPPQTPTSATDAAATLAGVPGPLTPASAAAAPPPDPDALLASSSGPIRLPIRLDLTVESLELAPSLADDPTFARVQVSVDLADLSEGVLLTERVRKPPPSQRTLVGHRESVPIYDAAFAARCLRVQAAAAASAAEGATPSSKAAPASAGQAAAGNSPLRFKSLAPPAPTTSVVVRLVGMGRGGIRDLGTATVSLEALLKTNYTNGPRKLEVLLTPPDDGLGAPDVGPAAVASTPSRASTAPAAASPRARQGGPPLRRGGSSGAACARVVLLGKLISRSAARSNAPPPAQRADEPQICVHAHSLRLPLRPPKPPADGVSTRDSTAPAAAAPPMELADVHSVWVGITISGLAEQVASETVRVGDLLKGGEAAAAAYASAAPAGGPPRPGTAGAAALARGAQGGAPGTRPTGGSGGSTLASISAQPSSEDLSGRRRGGRPGSDSHALLTWGEACPIDAVALLELFGDGAEAFEEMRAHLFRAAAGSGGEHGRLGEAVGGFGEVGSFAGAPPPSTPRSIPPSASSTPNQRGRPPAAFGPDASAGGGGGGGGGGITIELLGAGRNGHTSIGGLRLSLAELLASTGGKDLVGAPLRLRSSRGVVVAEVNLSVAISHAVEALNHGTPNLLSRGVGAGEVLAGSGAAVAVGAGEGYLMMKSSHLTLAGLLPTSIWVEVDLRRPLGQLLRSVAKPAGASRIEFNLRELLYVPDGSLQQRRLASAIHPHAPAQASLVHFSIYCVATRRARYPSLGKRAASSKPRLARAGGSKTGAKGAEAGAEGASEQHASEQAKDAKAEGGEQDDDDEQDDEEEEEGEDKEMDYGGGKRGGGGSGRYLLGRGSVSLRKMLTEGFEPLTEPLDLVDDDGKPAGMLSVSLLAKDALGRARRSSLRGPGTVELWIGAESLLVAPTLRSALSNAALWVEAHLEIPHVGSASDAPAAALPTLHVASRRVRMPRGAAAASGGLAATLSMALRGCISLPAGSSARAGLQRALKRAGGMDAALAFFLFSSVADGAPPAERRPLASCRVPLSELLDKAASAALRSTATSTATGGAADGLPLPVQLKNSRGELLATLAADVDGLSALRALAADGAAAPTGRSGTRSGAAYNDPEALRRMLAMRRSEAAKAAPAVEAGATDPVGG